MISDHNRVDHHNEITVFLAIDVHTNKRTRLYLPITWVVYVISWMTVAFGTE